MKISANKIGFALLGAAYLISVFLVIQRAAEAVTSDKITIRISQWQLEGGVRQAIDAIIRRYEELNPNVHVVQVAVPGGSTYLPWIQAQMVGGSGPDLVEYSWPWPDTARNFSPISAEVMEPNPYNRGTPLEGVPWRDTFIDGMNSPDNFVQTLSQYYGVSMTTGQPRIVYNRDLLKAITGRDAPPRTYREFMAICDQVRTYAKQHGLNLAPVANSRITHIPLTMEIVANLTGGMSERLDYRHRLKIEPEDVGRAYLRGEWNYGEPELVAAFSELRDVGLVSTPGFQQRERDSALTDFVSLRALMILAPAWESSSLKEICPFPLGAFRFPFPREDDPEYGRFARSPFGEGQVMTGMPFYLNRHTPHRAEALDFLRFMSSQEGSTIFTNVSDWLPIVVGVKPSEFSAQFQMQSQGYNWYGGVMGPSSHIDPQYFILNTLHNLWRADGSVAAFIQALTDGMAEKVRDNFRHDVIDWRNNARREDCAGAGLYEVATGQPRPETVRLVSLPNEINLYQTRGVLAQP